jgi:hypothetical protein
VRFVFVGLVALWYVFLDRPTTSDVVWLAVLLAALLAVLEFLARPLQVSPPDSVLDGKAQVG